MDSYVRWALSSTRTVDPLPYFLRVDVSLILIRLNHNRIWNLRSPKIWILSSYMHAPNQQHGVGMMSSNACDREREGNCLSSYSATKNIYIYIYNWTHVSPCLDIEVYRADQGRPDLRRHYKLTTNLSFFFFFFPMNSSTSWIQRAIRNSDLVPVDPFTDLLRLQELNSRACVTFRGDGPVRLTWLRCLSVI